LVREKEKSPEVKQPEPEVKPVEEKTVWVCWICKKDNEVGNKCSCGIQIEEYPGENFDKILKTVLVKGKHESTDAK